MPRTPDLRNPRPPIYHVAPRYTPGSPAQVDHETADRVAREEASAFLAGPAEEERGIEGIVYATTELRGTMFVEDLMTQQWYAVPLKYWQGHQWYARTDRARFEIKEHQPDSPRDARIWSDDMYE